MLLEGILLKCCYNFQNERTPSAVYHLLNGKKSIQTVQDSHIYDLKSFYGIYKQISKRMIDEKLNLLVKHHLLTKEFIPTADGVKWLLKNDDLLLFEGFNGIKYHTIAPVFSDRLLLLIQTLTNSKMQHLSFIPIIDTPPVLYWMKNYYRKIRSYETAYLKGIYEELKQLLGDFSEQDANLFVDRLSGYRTYGKTSHQLSESYQINLSDVPLVWIRMIHHILSVVYSNCMNYPALHSIISDIKNKILITHSAQQTFNLLHKNYSAEEIAHIRNLKLNTIYDHMVEIALFDQSFPTTMYVSKEQQDEIICTIKRMKTSALKQIKENVNEKISYFQIRLVLATVYNSKQHR
ncbi:helix-turn-helix domain-containing protein [Virgibacillus oceani]|uniref:Helicase Helix-turn-helix domain-containing protein n=1 Tax=Virgibacillus oceani TaxID=1479511 RepID=A0A917H1K3_9BACI|nr:helix-turn-helix domain-containing protein [Virgibacillus oceani]GGG65027.1 hypothetical protein GCM10011398_05820 [Virgibacillus oceani]